MWCTSDGVLLARSAMHVIGSDIHSFITDDKDLILLDDMEYRMVMQVVALYSSTM